VKTIDSRMQNTHTHTYYSIAKCVTIIFLPRTGYIFYNISFEEQILIE